MMRKMIKKIRENFRIEQKNSLIQVALQKSDGNTINIYGIEDSINELIKRGDHNGLDQLLNKIIDANSQSHPFYPIYKYEPIIIDSRTYFYHSLINFDLAKEKNLHLSLKGRFTVLDSEINKTNDVSYLLKKIYYSQRSIEIKMLDLESSIGETILNDNLNSIEQFMLERGKWSIEPFKVEPTITKLISKVNETEETSVIDYLELKPSNYDDSIIEISNIHQLSSPVIFKLFLPERIMEENSSRINFNLSLRKKDEGNAKSEREYLKILYDLIKSEKIELKDIKNNTLLIQSTLHNFACDIDEEVLVNSIIFYEKVIKVETFWGLEFKIPEKITIEDQKNIETLLSIVESGEEKHSFNNLNLLIDNKETLKSLILQDDKEMKLKFSRSIDISLWNHSIDNIICETEVDKVKVSNKNVLKTKLIFMDSGETVNVNLIPRNGAKLINKYKIANII